ncbi:MAG: NAD-dependent epimerase/dehydratase family protein [bacterium]
MKKVLVTGGAGFIGSHVVDGYLEQGWKVVVVDDLSSGKKENLNEKAKFYQIDIADESLDEIFAKEKFNLINHHAAQVDVRVSIKKPLFDAQVNILGTLNLLENCVKHRVNNFVFISSGGAVYGEPAHLPVNEYYPKNPLSPYGVSKHTIEHYLHYYRKTYGLNYLSLRYGNVYGPRQDPYGEAGVIAIFTQQMLRGKRPKIFGDGEQLRDYVHVNEVVNINLLASKQIESLNEKKSSSPNDLAYNVGTGKGSSVNLLYQLLSQITGFKSRPIYAPERKGEIRRIFLNTEKAKRELAWQSHLGLREGLEKTVNWFRENL